MAKKVDVLAFALTETTNLADRAESDFRRNFGIEAELPGKAQFTRSARSFADAMEEISPLSMLLKGKDPLKPFNAFMEAVFGSENGGGVKPPFAMNWMEMVPTPDDIMSPATGDLKKSSRGSSGSEPPRRRPERQQKSGEEESSESSSTSTSYMRTPSRSRSRPRSRESRRGIVR